MFLLKINACDGIVVVCVLRLRLSDILQTLHHCSTWKPTIFFSL